VDEDQSPLSLRIVNAFQPPLFVPPKVVTREEMDTRMDAGQDTFALNIPPRFQEDVLAGRAPTIQLNTDATRVGQAFSGSGYVQTIVMSEVQSWLQRYRSNFSPPVTIEERVRFNANLSRSWFGAVISLIDQITMLGVLLTGAALIRERERGTVEHLLVMPVTPFEIMTSKIWSMGLVVLVTAALSMRLVVQDWLAVPIQGSIPLFVCGAALHLFAVTSLGMFLATFARTMPQFALLMIMVLLPLQVLDGGMTPRESMPQWVQQVMLGAPTTHFVMLAQSILYRGAGMSAVWPQFLALAVIGTVLFGVALIRFRKTIGTMA
jgi:ABC-2 type transport system permease protein